MSVVHLQRVELVTFGAFLDGVHNDGPALRKAVEHIRSNSANQALYWTGTLLFGSGEAAIDTPPNLVLMGGENDGDTVLAVGGDPATASVTVFSAQAGRTIRLVGITLQGPATLNGKTLKAIDHAGGSGYVTFERVLATGLGVEVVVGVGATFVQDSINQLAVVNPDVITYQGDSVWQGAANGPGVVWGGGGSSPISGQLITASMESLVSDWNGVSGTDNTPALKAAFAALTTLKRAMYAPGQYKFGDGAGAPDPDVLVNQRVHIWGDGKDGQTLFKFSRDPAQLFGITVDGHLRLEDMATEGSPVAGPGNFNILFVPAGAGQVECRRMTFNGANQFTTGILCNGRSNVYTEDCNFGPLIRRAVRNEDGAGSAGTQRHVRPYLDTYDFCLDFSSTTTFDVDGGVFVASRDIGAGSIGVNSGNTAEAPEEPEYQRVRNSFFEVDVLHHLVSQGPYRRTYTNNRHTLGAAGIGVRAGSPVVIDDSNFQTPGVVAYVASSPYTAGQQIFNDGGKIYICTVSGTGSVGGPTGTGTNITAGTAHFDYVKAGVVNLDGNLAYSAVSADAATAAVDGFIAAGDRSAVVSSKLISAGVFLANISRGTDAGTQPWVFNDPVLENYMDTAADRANVIQDAGTIILNRPRFRRMPNGGGTASGIILRGGKLVINEGIFNDNRVVAAYIVATSGAVELEMNDCYFDGTFFYIQVLGAFTITLRGGENQFVNGATHNFDLIGANTLIRSYMKPFTAKGADTTTSGGSGGAGQLSTDMENLYVVTDAGAANRIWTRGIMAGPFGFRAGAGFTTVLTANAQGNGLNTNFGYVKTVAARVVGSTCWFVQDPVDKLWYEQD